MRLRAIYLAALSVAVASSGCATIISGTTQQITVATKPGGADCNLIRKGISIGHVNPTPSVTLIKKTKYDIQIVCSKPGYVDGTYLNTSGIDGWVFGNILLGGLIGWAIDGISGSDNKYDSVVIISMAPLLQTPPPPMPAPDPIPPLKN